MSKIDDLIRERLSKLRSEAQIPSAEPSSSMPTPSKKSSVEEVEYLLQRLTAQTELEEKTMNDRLDVDSQIRQRLEKLKAESAVFVGTGRRTTPMNVQPMEDVGPPPPSFDELRTPDYDSDDTCCMCDSAPKLVCSGCFNDLYCQECFTENHDPAENHQTRALPPKNHK
ncbi:unnamed protein product [Nesidiocoris tenuis]|uniref:Uncharacterized protein n=2 Tax=Nesidiocoris tenuis TaxID=355587 RepID=A0A6H5H9F6_9HEMI|nr:Hypothetical protein NTJ_05446 [Nesidiocoris tenuis]CAB0013238.1 unnamed protein product [Nesidiocoris tenuis]CAB0015554.1 unnamed protein product [Nesidiocoris tenuis]